MADRNYVEPILVLRGHLEEIYEALETATNYHEADDLAHKFKNIGGTSRPSNLTKRLSKALDRTESYLATEQEDLDGIPEV